MRHRVSPLVKKVTNTYIFLPQFSVILFLVPSIRILSLDTSCDFDSTIKVITRAISVKGDKKLRCSPFARKREDGPVRVFMFQFTFFLFFFFSFSFSFFHRETLFVHVIAFRKGKKAGQTILIAQEQDERWPTFFFFLERKKPRNETITLREEPKDQAMIHVALFSIAFFFIYIYVYLFVFYIYFKLDLKTYLLLSSAFFSLVA